MYKSDYQITLTAARHNAGLTQGEAAKLLGISMYTLLNYERGYFKPPVKVLRKMCEVYKDGKGRELPFDILIF